MARVYPTDLDDVERHLQTYQREILPGTYYHIRSLMAEVYRLRAEISFRDMKDSRREAASDA